MRKNFNFYLHLNPTFCSGSICSLTKGIFRIIIDIALLFWSFIRNQKKQKTDSKIFLHLTGPHTNCYSNFLEVHAISYLEEIFYHSGMLFSITICNKQIDLGFENLSSRLFFYVFLVTFIFIGRLHCVLLSLKIRTPDLYTPPSLQTEISKYRKMLGVHYYGSSLALFPSSLLLTSEIRAWYFWNQQAMKKKLLVTSPAITTRSKLMVDFLKKNL